MKNWIVYDPLTGRIRRGGTVHTSPDIDDEAIAAQAGAGEVAASTDISPDPRTAYVANGVVMSRASSPVSGVLVGRVLTLSGCPIGAQWHIGGDAAADGTTDAATMVFTLPPGNFFVFVDCFPSQDFNMGYIVT